MKKQTFRTYEEVKHPGAYLHEILKESGMTQHELAVRTDVSDKHVSSILSFEKGISASYARKLQYVFGADKYDWTKLQAEYDLKMAELQEKNNISNEELGVLKNLRDVIRHFLDNKYMHNDCGDAEKVMQLRAILQVSDLLNIHKIPYNAAYRLQISSNTNIDPYVLFSWQRMCEIETQNKIPERNFSLDRLKQVIPEIRDQMASEITVALQRVQELLADCGIGFAVVEFFRGAPVQGFIKKIKENKVILCLTKRGKAIDRFWFSLFHEIGHIVNGDLEMRFVDFDSAQNKAEVNADKFARDTIIPPDIYRKWVSTHRYDSLNDIKSFAKQVGVPHWAIIGRLHKDEWLPWSAYADQVPSFED